MQFTSGTKTSWEWSPVAVNVLQIHLLLDFATKFWALNEVFKNNKRISLFFLVNELL